MDNPVVNEVRNYSVEAILRDGSSIHLRAMRPDDKPRLIDHFARLSAQSVYFRFFRAKKRLSDAELVQFTEVDFVRNVALVATLGHGADEKFIGVGRYAVVDADGDGPTPRRAEVAFAVADEYQGRGVGTLLLDHLVPIARANGIEEFEADVLGENNRMLEVFGKSGCRVKRALEDGVFHVTFPTEETEEYLEASLARERHAAAESVRAVLEPRSVAVVGASARAGTIGAALVANIQRYGFTGPIYPVNPRAETIDGLRCYPTIGAIGAPVDLAIIAVAADRVETVLDECAHADVRGVVVISAGFAEMSSEGRVAQDRLRERARGSGMRLVGPNCMGVLNTDPAVSLNGTFVGAWPPVGNIGMLSQSGALGLAILDYVGAYNIGISSFVSVGNKADVSSNDLLCYWAEDPRTCVIVLYLESFGNPRRFGRVAPEVGRDKPIVAVKSGRSTAGTRAASSHSAALASRDVAVDALFEQAGVIRTNTLEELFDVAALLSTQPLPAGPRVGVVTNAGGPGILLADACEAHGLTLPELSEATRSHLRTFLPPHAGVANPVDMIASATPEHYRQTIAAVGNDPSIDALVVIYIPPLLSDPEEVARAIAAAVGELPAHIPALTVFISSKGAPAALGAGPRGQLPTYQFPEGAALALAASVRYGRWRARPAGTPATLSRFAQGTIRAVIDRVLRAADGPTWLRPADLVTVLRAAGIEFAPVEVTTADEAVETAERLGYPLVAKAISPGVLHKSDVGAVIMGLQSAADVAGAAATLTRRLQALGAPLEGILLQREVPGGIEAIVGVTSDPIFGPLLVCGLGGVLVELVHDVAFHLTPVTDIDAAEMLDKLRASRLLDGYRGLPPGDRAALVTLISRVSALVEIVPEILELDLNPVKVLAPGGGAIAVDGRIRIGPPPPWAGPFRH